ncbi:MULTISPECIES: hypothetical protein [Acinetobacter]|jgi:hypothetical protein|nr:MULTISPECIES: hypothetical protein [Acinetobacter]HRM14089.1 hypothetical protein [Acinetobacter parvus]
MSVYQKISESIEDFSCLREFPLENGLGIEISENCFENESLIYEKILILKLDEHNDFCSCFTHNPPAMIDFLIITQCCDESINLHLVEVRDTSGARRPTVRLNQKEIMLKFNNAIDLYLENHGRKFIDVDKVKSVKGYLVCDPWSLRDKDNREEIFKRKMKTSALDFYSTLKPLKVFNKAFMIEPELPNPVVECC